MPAIIIGAPPKSLALETRQHNPIANVVDPIISQMNKNQFDGIRSDYPRVVERSIPSGWYNCHGLTFASRRCVIEEADEVVKIITDDDYKSIDEKDVLPGDIVLYYKNGDLEHSGIVITKPEPQKLQPSVISKWGCYCEVIHYAHDCPYSTEDIRYYRIEE